MKENAESKYFVINESTGQKVSQKALPLEEAKKLIGKKLTESAGEKFSLREYLCG